MMKENPKNLRDTNAKNQMEDILDNEGSTNITRRNRILEVREVLK